MTEMCFLKALERDLSAIGSSDVAKNTASPFPSLISLCSTCHATNNNLVKRRRRRRRGTPTRVCPVSIVPSWKKDFQKIGVVRKSMGSDGFESGCEIFLFVLCVELILKKWGKVRIRESNIEFLF